MRGENASFTLTAYATFAGCFLGLHRDTTAQVVYVDIDPDSIFDERLEGMGLDMDQNGTIDFAFLNSSFYFYTFSFGTTRLRQDILAGPYTSANALAGISNEFNTGYSTFTIYYPFALLQGTLIDEELTWQTWGQQVMALKTFCEDGDLCGTAFSCNWYNLDNPITVNGYLGVKFIDEFGNNHYGWIRCDIKDEGRTLIIKDYAYDLQPDHAIIAGDTISYVDIELQADDTEFSVFCIYKIIHIHSSNASVFENATIEIFDLNGRIEYSGKILSDMNVIDMSSSASGVYIVKIKLGNSEYTKKIALY